MTYVKDKFWKPKKNIWLEVIHTSSPNSLIGEKTIKSSQIDYKKN